MSFRLWTAVAIAWMGLSASALAQESAREMELSREILRLAKSIDTMNTIMGTMAPMITEDYASRGVSRADAERMTAIFLEEFAAEQDAIIELAATAYAGAFTEAQLLDIRNFYASPSGQAFAEATPDLTAALSRAGAVIGEQVGMRSAQRLEDERRRDRDRGPS
jgi:hypothetical protein